MVTVKVAAVLPLLHGALGGVVSNRQQSPQALPTTWPSTYVALGDSFAAGIGAGKYIDQDSETKRCKRFNGSYPSQAKVLLPTVDDSHFNFQACSGDVLSGIDKQVANLAGQKGDVITLSISGNDFKFGNVVTNCVYNAFPFGDSAKDAGCQKALDEAATEVANEDIWNTYKTKVTNILSAVANPGQTVLVITGYARFFAEAVVGDPCDSFRFPMPFALIPGRANIMHAATRNKMNTLVAQVNANIQSKVLPVDPNSIRFVDIDSHFEGHRFCEKGKATDMAGLNDPNVWFTALGTNLDEKDFVADPNSALEAAWAQANIGGGQAEGSSNADGGHDLIPGLPSAIQQASSFHPKTQGHEQTAHKVQATVDEWARGQGHGGIPPPQVCLPTSATNIPSKIIAWPGSPNKVAEPNGILALLREVMCANQCKIPDNMDPKAGTVVSDATGRCEVSIGIEGGSEAYMLRDRSISGDAQVQHCWDTTWKIMDTCVKSGANEGWQGGVEPNPAFYQAGFRALNTGKHDPITADHLLPADLSSFVSICGAGDGHCDANGCEGVNFICRAGTYIGCNCGDESKFSMLPLPDHTLACKKDCCNTAPAMDYTGIWCAANCGGVSDQFC